MTVFLDPETGYLPRRIESGTFVGIVTEFRRLETGYWFPWSGRLNDEYDWELQELAINTELGEDLFRPPIGVGTVVTDTIRMREYVHGAVDRRPELETHIAQEARGNLQAAETLVQADPPRDSALLWSVSLLAISLLVLAAAFYLHRH